MSEARDTAHLVVVQHGMWGSASHTEYVADTLKEYLCKISNDVMVVNSSLFNGHSGTLKGIEVIGPLLADLIRSSAQELQQLTGVQTVSVSVIGYSLGGVLLRYAIGYLYKMGFWCTNSFAPPDPDKPRYVPAVFMSMASPHIGARRSPATMWGRIRHAVMKGGGWVSGQTGQELSLQDPCDLPDCQYCVTGRKGKSKGKERGGMAQEGCIHVPLLVHMSRPGTCFFEGLALFRARILVANVYGDRAVGYRSAAILPLNPYTKDGSRLERHTIPTTITLPIQVDIDGEKSPVGDGNALSSVPGAWDSNWVIGTELKHLYCDWIPSDEVTEPPTREDIDAGTQSIPDWVWTVDEARNAFGNDDKQRFLLEMISNLNQMPWRRIDINYNSALAHGVIVNRIPWYNSWGSDAVRYYIAVFVNELFNKMSQ